VSYPQTLYLLQLLSLFSLVIVVSHLYDNKRKGSVIFFYSLIIVSSFLALNGILEFSNRQYSLKDLHLFEPFDLPSLSASLFLLIAPLTLINFLIIPVGKVMKIIFFICLTLLVFAWFLSATYLIFLPFVLFFSLLTYLLWTKNKIMIKHNLTFLLLIILLGMATIPNILSSFGGLKIPKVVSFYQNGIYFQDNSDSFRLAAIAINKYFWFGIGPENFGPFYRQNLVKPWVWADYIQSSLLQSFIEKGFIGAVLETALLVYIFLICLKGLTFAIQKKDIPKATFAFTTASFIIVSLTNPASHVFPMMIIFFIFFSTLLPEERAVRINRKLVYLTVIFLFFVSSLILFDSLLLRSAQNSMVTRNNNTSANLLKFLESRPTFLLNPKVLIWHSATSVSEKRDSEATTLLQKAKVVSSFDPEIDYQIAAIVYREGKIEEAAKLLEEMTGKYQYLPPKYYLTLAKIALEENGTSRAIFWLNKAVFFYPLGLDTNTNMTKIKLSLLDSTNYLNPLSEIYYLLYDLTGSQIYLNSLVKLIY
jgi:hypothetical protein